MRRTSRRSSLFLAGLTVLGFSLTATEAAAGGSLFERVQGAFTPACGGQDGCWTNYLRMSDLDGDGDLDVVFANYDGFFNNGNPEDLAVYENDGGAFSNVSDTAVGGFSGRIRQIAIGDVDGDGNLDIYAPGATGEGSAFFMGAGDLTFADEYDARMPADQPRAGAVRFFDTDNDGDLDIFSSNDFITNAEVFGRIYINDGSGVFTEAEGALPFTVNGEDIDDVDIFDANGDFELDILVNAHSGDNSLWLSNGDGTFTDASDGVPVETDQPNFHYNPGVCDVDGDGDLDMWVDNIGPGFTEQLLINDGTGVFTDETAERVTGNEANDDNGVLCIDYDNDGDFDGVVVALSSPERLLENDGEGNFTFVGGAFSGPTDTSLWGEFGDVNGDARPDLVTGQGEGATIDELYQATMAVPADDTGPLFRAVEAASGEAGSPIVFRVAISDRVNSDAGPRLRSVIATLSGGGQEEDAPASFMGGDLFRVELPGQDAGEYTVAVCATDRAGNETCQDVSVTVSGAAGDTSGGAESDSADDSTGVDPTDSASASASDSASASASASASDSASASASASATAGDTDADTDTDSAGGDSDSSGCRTGGRGGWSGLLLLPLLLGLRRTGRTRR